MKFIKLEDGVAIRAYLISKVMLDFPDHGAATVQYLDAGGNEMHFEYFDTPEQASDRYNSVIKELEDG